jgi:hypothetical protein
MIEFLHELDRYRHVTIVYGFTSGRLDGNQSLVKVLVVEPERDDFTSTQTRAQQGPNERPVSSSLLALATHIDYAPDLDVLGGLQSR